MSLYSFYKTGRIELYDNLRIKQGLDPQSIANYCQQCNNVCDKKCLYPFKVVKLEYKCKNNPCCYNK